MTIQSRIKHLWGMLIDTHTPLRSQNRSPQDRNAGGFMNSVIIADPREMLHQIQQRDHYQKSKEDTKYHLYHICHQTITN